MSDFMKKGKLNKEEIKRKKEFNKGRVFVKIMAGLMVFLMISATAMTLIFALI